MMTRFKAHGKPHFLAAPLAAALCAVCGLTAANAQPLTACDGTAVSPALQPLVAVITVDAPQVTDTDPDWQVLIKDRVKTAMANGAWGAALKATQQRITALADTPVHPDRERPLARQTRLMSRGTGADASTAQVWAGTQRFYVFFEPMSRVQALFAKDLALKWQPVEPLRPVITGGSLRIAQTLFPDGTVIKADQGSQLLRRLGIHELPAVVRLTLTSIDIWTPALNENGVPDAPLPTLFQ